MVATGQVVTASSGGGTVAWTDISGKPTTFAPSAHTHPTSEVTGLDTALSGKAPLVHTHAIADTTGLQAALDGKSDTGHTHTIANVTGLQTALDGKAATSHSHEVADVTGLQADLDAKLEQADLAAYTAPVLVLASGDPVPGGTPAGTVIVRTA